MANIDKVIKGLEWHIRISKAGECKYALVDCPYVQECQTGNFEALYEDALTLLKGQEKAIINLLDERTQCVEWYEGYHHLYNIDGLTKERYKQLLVKYVDNDISAIVRELGTDKVNRGWDIVDHDGTGLLEIQAIDAVGAYTDEEAVEKAIENGIKIIPVEELPENFDKRYLGWIDTPENRANIKLYTEKYCK